MRDIKMKDSHAPKVLDRQPSQAERVRIRTKDVALSQDVEQLADYIDPGEIGRKQNTDQKDRLEGTSAQGSLAPAGSINGDSGTVLSRASDPSTATTLALGAVQSAMSTGSDKAISNRGSSIKERPQEGTYTQGNAVPANSATVAPDVRNTQLGRPAASTPSTQSGDRSMVRTKPKKDIKKRDASMKERPQEGTAMNPSRAEPSRAGMRSSAPKNGRLGTPAGAASIQAATAVTKAVSEQESARPESAQMSPRTQKVIQQAAVSTMRQSAYIARQTVAGAAGAIIGKDASSQRVRQRSTPRGKSAQTMKLLKRGVTQAGRGVKYAADMVADHLSGDTSSRRSNPDNAISDLAAQQAQRLAAKVAQAASRKAAQAAGRVAAKVSAQAAKLAVKAAQVLFQAAAKAISAFVAATGPVGVIIIVVLFVAILAAVVLSPMGIFAGGGGNGTPSIAEIARTLNGELSAKISSIQQQVSPVDEIQIVYEGSEDNTFISNWPDVLSVFAVKVSMDAEDPLDVVVMDEVKQGLLREVFWDMNSVSYTLTETDVPQPSHTPQASASPTPSPSPSPSPTPVRTSTRGPIMLAASRYAWDDVPEPIVRSTSTTAAVHKSLEINVNSRSYSEMEDAYHFTEEQRRMLQELMDPDMQSLFYNLVGQSPGASLTPDQINQIRARLPEGLDVQREQIALAAYSLVGKVEYFWGGKSLVVGWDERWGKPRKVTSKGNPTTGTIRPFGLDCSGFVAWTFVNGGFPKDVIQDAFGTGSSVQWKYSVPIRWDEIMPGDLVFYNVPGTSKGNHVAVCVGFSDEGKPLIAESPRTGMRVKVSVASKSFKYVRRPIVLMN